MEIFIVGAIVVVIMAYVSTRVKRIAREAYEQEKFETEHFTIVKPDGFIIPVKPESNYLFEAYSKDYGDDESDKFNQCWATINEKDREALSENNYTAERIEESITIKSFIKILESSHLEKSYELEISLLPEYEEKFSAEINLMLETFALK